MHLFVIINLSQYQASYSCLQFSALQPIWPSWRFFTAKWFILDSFSCFSLKSNNCYFRVIIQVLNSIMSIFVVYGQEKIWYKIYCFWNCITIQTKGCKYYKNQNTIINYLVYYSYYSYCVTFWWINWNFISKWSCSKHAATE